MKKALMFAFALVALFVSGCVSDDCDDCRNDSLSFPSIERWWK